MNFVESIMESIASNFGNREGIELDLGDLEMNIKVNCAEISYNPQRSKLSVDPHGDATLELRFYKDDFMEELLDEEDMVKHLKNIGYNVTWWKRED